jgi:O-antigen/teichoic acid export membrane protein
MRNTRSPRGDAPEIAPDEVPIGGDLDSAMPRAAPLRRNAMANIAGRGVSVLLWVVVTPFALHRLGNERFGIWSLFFVLSGYVATLDLGMSAGVSRFVAMSAARGDRLDARRVILRSLLLSAGLGLVWALACVVSRGLFVRVFHVPAAWIPEVGASLAIFAGSLLVFSIAQVLQGALVGFQRLDLWNFYFLTGQAVNTAVLCLGLAAGLGLRAAAWAAVCGHSVVLLLSARSVRAELRRLAGGEHADRASWKDLLGFGAMIQLSNFFNVGQTQAPKVLLGAAGRLVGVTQFELGFKVTNGFWSLPTLIQSAVAPAVAHAVEVGGDDPARAIYEWCSRWIFMLTSWLLGMLWLVAPALFHLWLGESRPEAVAVARWLVAAFMISTLGGPATAVGRGKGWPGLEALNFGVAVTVNVVAGLWLVPRFGAPGAAMAMVVSYVVASTCLVTIFHHRLHVSTFGWLSRQVVPRFAPAVAIAAALWYPASRWPSSSRAGALLETASEAVGFTLLYAALTWRNGDARLVWTRARGWLARGLAMRTGLAGG